MFNLSSALSKTKEIAKTKSDLNATLNMLTAHKLKYPRFSLRPSNDINIAKYEASGGRESIYKQNILFLDDVKKGEDPIVTNKWGQYFEFEFFDKLGQLGKPNRPYYWILPMKNLTDPNALELERLFAQAKIELRPQFHIFASIYVHNAYYQVGDILKGRESKWVHQRQVLRLNDRNLPVFQQRFDMVEESTSTLRGLYMSIQREADNQSIKSGSPQNIMIGLDGKNLARPKLFLNLDESQIIQAFGHDAVRNKKNEVILPENGLLEPIDFVNEFKPMTFDQIAMSLKVDGMVAGGGTTGVTNYMDANTILSGVDAPVDSVHDISSDEDFMNDLLQPKDS